jgi:peptide/nickel transport system substrate-binding protein
VTLEINSGGGRNEKVAEAVQKMLEENLNVDVEITQVVWAQHTNNIETGKTSFWRLGWVADYPDPNNFLNLFYGKIVPKTMEEAAYMNSFRYINPKYDEMFEKALATTNEAERNKLYYQLEQIVIDDAPLLPIYYSVNRRLIQPYVKNFDANAMEFRAFREVWLDKQ